MCSRCCTKMQILACVIVALTYWLTVVFILRYSFKLLLMYKGWMFETRGKMPSLPTKLWLVLIKILRGWNTPRLYSYQGSLPRLPLPSVRDTMQRVRLTEFYCFNCAGTITQCLEWMTESNDNSLRIFGIPIWLLKMKFHSGSGYPFDRNYLYRWLKMVILWDYDIRWSV